MISEVIILTLEMGLLKTLFERKEPLIIEEERRLRHVKKINKDNYKYDRYTKVKIPEIY